MTRLLQDSLGGNTRTVLIAAVSPIFDNSDETISTLKFADRAKQVMVKIKANEVDATDQAVVKKLHEEVLHLRQVLNLRKKGKTEEIQRRLISLQKENNRLRLIASDISEVEHLKLENKIMKLELQKIRQEEGSQYYNDNDGIGSYNASMSQFPPNTFDPATIFKYGVTKSEIEKPIESDNLVKCPLCNKPPPCQHYNSKPAYGTSSIENPVDLRTHRLENNKLQKKNSNISKLSRSRENLIDDIENPYSINEKNSRSASKASSRVLR